MHKVLSVLSLLGFIISSAKADGTAQASQAVSDVPQQATQYVQSAPLSDALSLLNSPIYDPSVHQNFIQQDPVQQYVGNYPSSYGIEGFLVPGRYRQEEVELTAPTIFSIIRSLIPGPKFLLIVLAKLAAMAVSAIGIVFFGGAITTFVCAFTPLCTISFIGLPLALLRKETKDIADKIVSEVTVDRVKRAADLLKLAFDKYQQMQTVQ